MIDTMEHTLLEDVLKQAMYASDEERAEIFARLAQTPETSLEELAEFLQRPAKHVWSAALQVIRVLRYPGNAAILPLVVEHLVDGNWPGWCDAIDVLGDIDPAIVAPLLIAIFLEQGKKREYWESDVEGICMALVHLGKAYIAPCIPSTLFVLARRQGLDDPDPDFLLQALEKAAIYEDASALPVLIGLSGAATNEEIRAYADNLIERFPSKALALYQCVWPSASSQEG